MKQKELKEILKLHNLWLNNKEGGKQANLRNTDLSYVNLSYVDLSYANLSYANLKGTNLTGANLSYANLQGANLKGTNLSYANLTDADLSYVDFRHSDLMGVNLSCANLSYADLKGVNLTGADLKGADLTYANLREVELKDLIYNSATSFFALQCPEKGSFIGWKKANGMLIELLITEDALRSSATSRKCRCSKAKVLKITNIGTGEEVEKISSGYDSGFIYKKGEIVAEKNFDKDRWNECTRGIHFFITKQEAINY